MTRPPLLDRATARAVIAPVRPDYPVTEVVRRTGGEVSAVYEIRGAGGVPPLIVKVYSPQWRSKLVKEVYVYRLLARNGIVHIPRVLHASPFGTPELPWAHIVMTRLAGRPLAEVRDHLAGAGLAAIYRRMGELLSAIHRIAQPHWGYLTTRVVDSRPTNTAYMTDQFGRRLREFSDLGGHPALARAVDRHVARHTYLFAGCDTPVLCHNDFHDSNVLVAPADEAPHHPHADRTAPHANPAPHRPPAGLVAAPEPRAEVIPHDPPGDPVPSAYPGVEVILRDPAAGLVVRTDPRVGRVARAGVPRPLHDARTSKPPDGWRVVGYVDVEGAIAADPLLDVARTDYQALHGNPAWRAAFLDGYGPLPADWANRLAVYRLHHALELWNWATRTGKPAECARAATDIEAGLAATRDAAARS